MGELSPGFGTIDDVPFFDTIAAPITGLQPAAVAVVRISGPDAWVVASRVFSPWTIPVQPRLAVYGQFANGDDGLALPFEDGHSYTGEESAELSVHGSLASVRSLLELIFAAGARPAEPGEFTQRAFLNGRIDLTQAEGVRDTVSALTDAQLRAASELREGRLRGEVSAILAEVEGVLVAVEASTDFSEEIGDLDRAAASARLLSACERISVLLETAQTGRILREGFSVAIVGLPNAGKSSLLNVLLGMDRAIVTAVPGTTRDTVEELADIGGVPCQLIDTAGLREAGDEVERIGVERALAAGAQADLVLYVFDSAAGWTAADETLLSAISRPVLVVANKADLADAAHEGIRVSTVTRFGLDVLVREIVEFAGLSEVSGSALINRRHEPLLREALEELGDVRTMLGSEVPVDLASVGLRSALMKLGEITGETATPDLIERIFHDFCIGK